MGEPACRELWHWLSELSSQVPVTLEGRGCVPVPGGVGLPGRGSAGPQLRPCCWRMQVPWGALSRRVLCPQVGESLGRRCLLPSGSLRVCVGLQHPRPLATSLFRTFPGSTCLGAI